MQNNLLFLAGLSVGLSVTVLMQVYSRVEHYYRVNAAYLPSDFTGTPVYSRYKENDSKFLMQGDSTVAEHLYTQVRVACWILTSPSNLDRKAIYIKHTWGRKCQLFLFMSSVQNDSFPTVGLNVSEGRNHLTAKSMQAFQYLYDNHLNDADWFLKADDDTYIIMENLRYFLSEEDHAEPVYFGQRFKFGAVQRYASGGAGYVISRESLRRFGERRRNHSNACREDLGNEDVEFGQCLESLGVKLKSSLDLLSRHRFHCHTPEAYLRANFPSNFKTLIDGDGGRAGIENMSNYAISFHYISGVRMFDLEFYVYHLRPYGVLYPHLNLNVADTES